MIIHASGLMQWQRCKRKHFFADRNMGLGFQAKTPSDPLLLGTWVHAAMYHWYNQGIPLLEGFTEAVKQDLTKMLVPYGEERWETLLTLGRAMLSGYEQWVNTDTSRYADPHLEFLDAEQQFAVQFDDDTITGTWDGLVRLDDGGLWVFETKTTNNLEELWAGLAYDWQPRLYVWAAEQIVEEPVLGVIYNGLRKQNPYNFKRLQNGLPSLAKNELAKTTFDIYLEVYAKAAANLADGAVSPTTAEAYAQALIALRDQPNTFFQRYPYRVPRPHLNALPMQLEEILSDMRRDKLRGSAIPSFDRYTCVPHGKWGGCPFLQACQAMDDGRDYVQLLELTMNRKEPEQL